MYVKVVLLFAIFLLLAACNADRTVQISANKHSEISNFRSGISNRSPFADDHNPETTININTATETELQRIPHVGKSLAGRIIEHRERYGPFKRPEQLMLIQGISDLRFRRIRHLVRVE